MSEVLEVYESRPRYVAGKLLANRAPGLVSGPLAPIRLADRRDPEPPALGWGVVKVLLAGICGSDLATITGKVSPYFGPLVSYPFVPGHEIVGELVDDMDDLPRGTRVVLDPVLGCLARGYDPCAACATGLTGRCERITAGHIAAGLQTGYCADTGGGWGHRLVAHRSQLRAVPDDISNEKAVLVEPFACAIHSVLRAHVQPGATVSVIGAGSIGLLTVAALKAFAEPEQIIVVAKHPKQQDLARQFGATHVIGAKDAVNQFRRITHAMRVKPELGSPYLMGGVDTSFECVGSRSSLDLALRTTRAGGTIVASAIPASNADLSPLWARELHLIGAYTTGLETLPGGKKAHSFDLALEQAAVQPIDQLLGATYALARWRDALDHALSAGSLGTAKIAFEPRRQS